MYCLPGTRWYIAELIEEISIDAWPRQIVQHNARFIFAHSPEEAYEQALALESGSQRNEKLAHTRYWGLAHLNIVQEDLRQPEKPVFVYGLTAKGAKDAEVTKVVGNKTDRAVPMTRFPDDPIFIA